MSLNGDLQLLLVCSVAEHFLFDEFEMVHHIFRMDKLQTR